MDNYKVFFTSCFSSNMINETLLNENHIIVLFFILGHYKRFIKLMDMSPNFFSNMNIVIWTIDHYQLAISIDQLIKEMNLSLPLA